MNEWIIRGLACAAIAGLLVAVWYICDRPMAGARVVEWEEDDEH